MFSMDILPEPERAVGRLVAGDELADVLEHVQRQAARLLDVGEQIQLLDLSKQSRRHALLDQDGPCTVLDVVQLGHALALQAQQRADHRGPAEHGNIRVMEDIVEAVVVGLGGVIVRRSPTNAPPDR